MKTCFPQKKNLKTHENYVFQKNNITIYVYIALHMVVRFFNQMEAKLLMTKCDFWQYNMKYIKQCSCFIGCKRTCSYFPSFTRLDCRFLRSKQMHVCQWNWTQHVDWAGENMLLGCYIQYYLWQSKVIEILLIV